MPMRVKCVATVSDFSLNSIPPNCDIPCFVEGEHSIFAQHPMFVEAAVMLSQGHAPRLAHCLDGQCCKVDFKKIKFSKMATKIKIRHNLAVALTFAKFTSKQRGDFDGHVILSVSCTIRFILIILNSLVKFQIIPDCDFSINLK